MRRAILIVLLLSCSFLLCACNNDFSYGNVTWYGPDGVHTWEGVSKVEVKDNGRFIFHKNGKKIIIYNNILVEGN
jgi:hypothetical protein